MENNYELMNSSDIIPENWNKLPWAIYVALDFSKNIIAAGNYDKVYCKAVSRGCTVPYVENATKLLTQKQVNSHNNLLQKALSDKENNRKRQSN